MKDFLVIYRTVSYPLKAENVCKKRVKAKNSENAIKNVMRKLKENAQGEYFVEVECDYKNKVIKATERITNDSYTAYDFIAVEI